MLALEERPPLRRTLARPPRDDNRPRTVGITCFLLAALLAWPTAVVWGQASQSGQAAAAAEAERAELAGQRSDLQAREEALATRLVESDTLLQRADAAVAGLVVALDTTTAAVLAASERPGKGRRDAGETMSSAAAALARETAALAAWRQIAAEVQHGAEAP